MVSGATTKGYSLSVTGAVLLFRTARFSAERESVLHKGIYNKDFAAALSSLAAAGLVYALLALNYRRSFYFHLVFAFIFIGGYPLLRTFVFKDRLIEVVLDSSKGTGRISIAGLLRQRVETISLAEIENVLIETKKFGVENPDAVEFVEKISAQHGTVIPGFGEEQTFYMLKLILVSGAERMIYADGVMEDVIDAREEIAAFLEK